MSAFTDDQIAALRAPLAREHVKSRQQAGRSVCYIEGWHAIAEANRIFGFAEWDRELIEFRCVSEKSCEIGAQKKPGFRVAYIGKVRVTVRVGDRIVVREGAGYGSGIDADVGEAHESAIKEMETDSMKRALMTFGNPFGLALYDKTQAEVEPMPRALRAERPAASPPPQERRQIDPERARKVEAGRERRDRIKAALENAGTPRLVDEIIAINEADLAYIKDVHEPAYDALMQLAVARKNELLAAA